MPAPGQAGHGGQGAAGPGIGDGEAARFRMCRGGAGRQEGPGGIAGLGGECGQIVSVTSDLDSDVGVGDRSRAVGAARSFMDVQELPGKRLRMAGEPGGIVWQRCPAEGVRSAGSPR